MGSKSNYLENKILDHVLKVASYTAPTNLYLALSTADPTDSGGSIAEPSGGSYARVQCNTHWATASGGASSNSTAISFATASGSWGTITHWALFDASTSGNMLYHGSVVTPKAIGIGDTATFPIGDIDITED